MKTKQPTSALAELQALLNRKEFRPFAVNLKGGETYEFNEAKDGMYRPDKGWVYWFGGEGPMAFFKAEDITSVEVL